MPRDTWDPLATYLRGIDVAIFRRPRAVPVVTGTHSSEAAQSYSWLTTTAAHPDVSRLKAALSRWEEAQVARASHSDEEHLIPLMVAAGVANDGVWYKGFSAMLGEKPLSSFTVG